MKTKFLPSWLRLITVFILLLAAFTPTGTAHAATCTVTSDLDDGSGGTLREMIADPLCDTINFDSDYTIVLAYTLTIGRNVTIDGAGHIVTISGNNAVRVFWVDSDVTFNPQNLTVANGFAGPDGPDGGGMWVDGANGHVTTVNIAHVTFSDNVNTYGFGMGGGGISSYNGDLTLMDVTFRDNQAMTGGGMSTTYGNVILSNVTFSGNSALGSFTDGYGCGGLISGMSHLTMTNVTFSNNSAEFGGGMCKMMGSATLTNVTFNGNQAAQMGGAIYNNSSFFGGPLTVVNSILWGNMAPEGAQIYDAGGVAAVVTYSDVQGGWDGMGNIDADPLLGPLADNGGSTKTMALLPGSAAIDVADDSVCPATDQRGVARPQGAHCDIGAYEYEAPADTTPPVVTVTGVTEGATYLLGAVPAAGCSTTDEGSGVAVEASLNLSGGNALGVGNFTATCSGAVDNAGNAAEPVSVQYSVTFLFTGFSSPVDNNGVLNLAKAGQTIPLKWRITDADGNPITNLTSVTVTAVGLSCSSGASTDEIEQYTAGGSGLQNLGDGYYQWNWKSPSNYANSCKTLKLNLGEGAGFEHIALFQFKK